MRRQEAPGSVRFGSVLARTVPVPPVPVLVPVPPVPVPAGSGSKPVPVHSKCWIWVRLNRTEDLVPPLEPEFRDLSFFFWEGSKVAKTPSSKDFQGFLSHQTPTLHFCILILDIFIFVIIMNP